MPNDLSPVSGVRAGFKRELAFALEAQSHLSPMGRTRSGKIRSSSLSSGPAKGLRKGAEGGKVGALVVLESEGCDEKKGICLVETEERNAFSKVNGEEMGEIVEVNGGCFNGPESKRAEVEVYENGDKGTEKELVESGSTVNGGGCGWKVEDLDGLKKPGRRFTRSLLKSAVEERVEVVNVSSAGTSSSCSDGSDERYDEGGTRKTLKKKELKMSKKISLTKMPTNVKELLATGMLNGFTVKCNASNKARELRGVIKDGRIICSCSSCKGMKALSAYQFELHGGSSKMHSSEDIFLENGSTIHDVLRACTCAPLNTLESIIQNVTSLDKNNHVCQQCNEPIQLSRSRSGKPSSICDSCLAEKPTPYKNSLSTPHKRKRLDKSPSVPASSDSLPKDMALEKKSGHGRVTRKDIGLHKLVFMDNILPEGMEVGYYNKGERLLEGYIKGSGIFCCCCNTVVSPSQFEAHAGWGTRRKPYLNIYTSNGVSLHELSVSLSKDKKFSARENDDLCRVCSDGGDLLLCDVCPRAFHMRCVGLSSIPEGDWYCPCCESMHQREGFVSHNDNAFAAGRVSGVDPIEQIFKRCVRIVQMPETDISSCVLCKSHDFSNSDFGPRTVLICDQCEKEFHIGCLKEHNIADLEELPKGEWFCCSDCQETHAALQNFLSSGLHQLPDSVLENIKRKQVEKGIDSENDFDMRWRLLNGKMDSPDCKLLLSKAVSVFHESFDPIIDLSTGQDLILSMVYGKNMKDQDFGGMYTALLIVNSSVVSVGLLRVLGRDVAELPLVATTMESQGLGYFQLLFSCIERLLESMSVKHLILPATKEAEAIWTKKFGFSDINLKQLGEYTKGSRPMNFQGTPVLHKQVSESQNSG